jgi:hypothetical protein
MPIRLWRASIYVRKGRILVLGVATESAEDSPDPKRSRLNLSWWVNGQGESLIDASLETPYH